MLACFDFQIIINVRGERNKRTKKTHRIVQRIVHHRRRSFLFLLATQMILRRLRIVSPVRHRCRAQTLVARRTILVSSPVSRGTPPRRSPPGRSDAWSERRASIPDRTEGALWPQLRSSNRPMAAKFLGDGFVCNGGNGGVLVRLRKNGQTSPKKTPGRISLSFLLEHPTITAITHTASIVKNTNKTTN